MNILTDLLIYVIHSKNYCNLCKAPRLTL